MPPLNAIIKLYNKTVIYENHDQIRVVIYKSGNIYVIKYTKTLQYGSQSLESVIIFHSDLYNFSLYRLLQPIITTTCLLIIRYGFQTTFIF